jgi:hypothetical protein
MTAMIEKIHNYIYAYIFLINIIFFVLLLIIFCLHFQVYKKFKLIIWKNKIKKY